MTLPWWKTAVVYQIYPRSFADANGDGVGDLAGITARLDYLNDGSEASLGIDAIWLSPIYPSPQKDFGYDVSDYCAIDPLFGTMSDFDTLVEEAHARGIRVIMDWVVNHSSDQHPWFTAARASRDDPKRDWYVWHDGKRGRPPNNWASVFGGSAWTWDPRTSAYYLHSFLPEQPDLNWHHPELRQAIWDGMRFWTDRGVDGFRLDVCNCYVHDPKLRDNPRRWSPAGLVYSYLGQHHVHDRDQRQLLGIFDEMRAQIGGDERLLVGEVMDEREQYTMAAVYCSTEGHGLHLCFNFQLLHTGWDARAMGRAIREWEGVLPKGWPSWVLSNHDVVRQRSRFGDGARGEARARLAAITMLTLRGTPFLYYGEELGMREGRLRRREIQDPPGRRFWPFYKGRDGCRTPMPWDASPHAGFTTGTPWLRVNPDYRELNVAAQQDDSDSLLSLYRRLIWLRKHTPALAHGAMAMPEEDPVPVLTWRREAEGSAVRVVINTAGDEASWVVPQQESYRVLVGTHDRDVAAGDRLALRPHEGLVLEIRPRDTTAG